MPLADLRGQSTRRTPDERVAQLQSFTLEPKFSAGIWYFQPMASRFHDAYGAGRTIEERLDIAAGLKDAGLCSLEAHYPNEINEDNADLWKAFSRDTGIRLLTVIPLLFWDARFEWGSLSNPIEAHRRFAIERLVGALRMNREFDTDFAVVWPGIDGFENPFGVDQVGMRARFIDGLVEGLDAVPGVRIAFEPKPYEPRGRILFGTTPEGVLLGRDVEEKLSSSENRRLLDAGHKLVCLNPEVGHALMGFEDLSTCFGWALGEGRLAHTHWNSQPLGNYDQDLNAGVVSPEQMEAGLYVLKMHGYDQHFGIDVNPERMPVETAIRNSIDAIRVACDRVNALDHASIVRTHERPDESRGWLEAHLIRARAGAASKLAPLDPLA
ncbi:MAG: TIM barrel protein [Phycisphaerales bacterium JB037]